MPLSPTLPSPFGGGDVFDTSPLGEGGEGDEKADVLPEVRRPTDYHKDVSSSEGQGKCTLSGIHL
jgi:hypothetical protein